MNLVLEDLDEVPKEIYRAFSEEFEDELVCFHNHIFIREKDGYSYQGCVVRCGDMYLFLAIESSVIRKLDMDAVNAFKDM